MIDNYNKIIKLIIVQFAIIVTLTKYVPRIMLMISGRNYDQFYVPTGYDTIVVAKDSLVVQRYPYPLDNPSLLNKTLPIFP